ncbi:MAG: DUF3465 domain-containing protein [Pseudomonadota bacterium]
MSISSKLASLLIVLAIAGCGGGNTELSNDRLIETFTEGRTGIWVSGSAPVTQILGDENIAGNFQRFVVRLNDEIQVTIRHSLNDSDRIPVERGDEVSFQGLYDWDARGGFVSRTHNDPAEPGGGGWVEHDGTRYD